MNDNLLIAKVLLPIPLNKTFDYFIPKNINVVPFTRVRVPFGKRILVGIISKISNQSEFPQDKIKSIFSVLDNSPIFSVSMQILLNWAANYYFHPIGETYFNAIPTLLRKGNINISSQSFSWKITDFGKNQTKTTKLTKKQKIAIDYFRKKKLNPSEIIHNDIHEKTLNSLYKNGWIEPVLIEHSPWINKFSVNFSQIKLNNEQISAINEIENELDFFQTWLIEGRTGSGKTEVYLQLIEKILKKGKQVLVLVPEISLTPQTFSRFNARFNVPIEMLHSGLNDSERLKIWQNTKSNQNAIIIGTRSAIFSSFADLGLIIIDEEHDLSYKQQDRFHYHARDLAIFRAKLENIPIILGSATPSLESLHNVIIKKYRHILIKNQANLKEAAKKYFLPLNDQKLISGLSPALIDEMKIHLAKNNQVFLFLNRRGFSPVLICTNCKWIATCSRCDQSFTFYQEKNQLICHHCFSQKNVPNTCPNCNQKNLIPIGVGTEQLEKTLSSIFPDIPITRIDSDTISHKHSLEFHLNQIHQNGARILIGTQILAKGHHFPHLTLVGIINADGALFSSNFRATEHFAQLFTQVAGRAGRENKTGKVILQTYFSQHPFLIELLKFGYHKTALELLKERKQIPLPPFTFQIMLNANAHNLSHLIHFLHQIRDFAEKNNPFACIIIGPYSATIAKKAGKHRQKLLFQHKNRKELHQFIHSIQNKAKNLDLTKKIQWRFEVDPIEN